jgi:hypothetical protein
MLQAVQEHKLHEKIKVTAGMLIVSIKLSATEVLIPDSLQCASDALVCSRQVMS